MEAHSHTLLDSVTRIVQRNPGWILAALALPAGVLTGAVTIRPILWLAAGGLLMGALLRYLYDRWELGTEIAGRNTNRTGYVFAAIFTFNMLVIAMPRPLLEDGLAIATIVSDAWLGYYLLRWPLRTQWAGPLILELSRPRPAWMWVQCGLLFACTAAFLFTKQMAMAMLARDLFYSLMLVLLGIMMFVLYPRIEIRPQGVLSIGRLIRWSRIESYDWEASRDEYKTLRVRSKGLAGLFPAERFTSRRSLREEHEQRWNSNCCCGPGNTDNQPGCFGRWLMLQSSR